MWAPVWRGRRINKGSSEEGAESSIIEKNLAAAAARTMGSFRCRRVRGELVQVQVKKLKLCFGRKTSLEKKYIVTAHMAQTCLEDFSCANLDKTGARIRKDKSVILVH